MRIIEVITKKTLKGEEVRYVLQGGSDRSTTVMMDQIDGEVFDNAQSARMTLTSRARKQIDKMVDAAIAKSKEWYGESTHETPRAEELPSLPPPDFEAEDVEEQEQEAVQSIVLPDGTVAKVKLPKITAA